MRRFELDLHIHTLASGHAFSTIFESAKVAKEKGLKGVAFLEHGPALPGGAHPYYFSNLRVLPREINGVYAFFGVEANITGINGELDLEDSILLELDLVAIAFHPHCGYENQGAVKNTQVLLKAMENPYVDMIAHPANQAFPLEIDPVIEAAKERKIIIEVNNSSLLPTATRYGAKDLTRELALKCLEKKALIAVNSDAHYSSLIGDVGEAYSLIEEKNVSSELIINSKLELFLNYLKAKGKGER